MLEGGLLPLKQMGPWPRMGSVSFHRPWCVEEKDGIGVAADVRLTWGPKEPLSLGVGAVSSASKFCPTVALNGSDYPGPENKH
jgi:hypothetical protein